MSEDDPWDAEVAAEYDTPGTGMFAPEVLNPVVERLAALAEGGRVLEFAIGTGRVAVPLRQRGVAVSGIELSAPMLAELRRKLPEAELPAVQGDMTTTFVEGSFALVYLVFNTISNLLTQAEQVECFRNAARHLAPGGRFVIELWVPQLPHPAGPQAVVGQAQDGYILVDRFDTISQHVTSHHFRHGADRAARLFRSAHRYIWPAELDLMGQLAGFELESRHADWAGGEFTAASGSHVSVYRLRGAA